MKLAVVIESIITKVGWAGCIMESVLFVFLEVVGWGNKRVTVRVGGFENEIAVRRWYFSLNQ